MTPFRESDVLKLLVPDSPASPHVVEGVGDRDDCAVLSLPAGQDVCATTDFVRGTGFTLHRLGHLGFFDLGWYVVAANVSDLASMGATPVGYLSVLRYGPSRTLSEVAELLQGISSACAELACPLVGGDTGSYSVDVLSGTALGMVAKGRRLSRSTFRPGFDVYVSGTIGAPAAALAAATAGIAESVAGPFEQALRRWRRPSPRIALGRALADLPTAIAAMDVSDGLTASLQQLQRIANVGFVVDAASLPLDDVVDPIADALRIDRLALACGASVDFELLVGADPEHRDRVMTAAERAGTRLTRIGRCVEGEKCLLRLTDGTLTRMPGSPWDHQTTQMADLFARV